MIYEVVDKITGKKIYEYTADSPVEWSGMSFVEYDHNIIPSVTVIQPSQEKTWTPHEFRRLFTTQEQENILSASKTNISLENYLNDLALAPEVRSNDPLLVAALSMLETSGLIGEGRAQEILNG